MTERSGPARSAPAALRNREPILEVLRRVLPPRGTILEIASGTGEHAVHFAAAQPDWIWQPSDPDAQARASVATHTAGTALPNMREPIALDASLEVWPIERADAILCINMIHIAPWSATEGLMAGAQRLLPAGAPLVLYGPFREHSNHTAASNAAFDEDLRRRNPSWGVRDLEEVAALAQQHGLRLAETIAMPANNRVVVFRREG